MPRPQNPLVVSAFNGGPFVSAGLPVIVARRAPLTSDRYQIGQVWCQSVNTAGVAVNVAWVLTSILNNSATWQEITNAGGGGAIAGTSLTITPGPTSLTGALTVASAGNAVNIATDAVANTTTIGNVTGASALVLQSGTGDISLSPADAGDIFIGTATQTAPITLGRSASGQAVSISGAVNTGVQSVSIASGANGAASTVNIANGASTAGLNSVNILSGALGGTSTGEVNIANGAYGVNTAVSVLNGIGTAGAGSFDLLSNAGQTQNATINIGRGGSVGAGANSIVLGATHAGSSTTVAGENSTIVLDNTSMALDSTVAITIDSTATVATTASGDVTLESTTAEINLTTAAPAVAAGGILVTQGGVPFRILCGAGAPNVNLAIQKGDLYINSTGSGVADRMYICDGPGSWTNFVSAA